MGWIPVPGPIYVPHEDWSTHFPKRGKFGKYKKISATEEIMNYEKNRPTPRTYDNYKYKLNRSPGTIKT